MPPELASRMLRRIAAGAAVALVATFASAMLIKVEPPERFAPELVREVHEREIAAATAIGFTVAEEGQATAAAGEGEWTYPLSVNGGECVAVIASTAGPHGNGPVALRPRAFAEDPFQDVARARSWESPVTHVQACAEVADEWLARMRLPQGSGQPTRFTVLRAPAARVDGNAGLIRGWVPR